MAAGEDRQSGCEVTGAAGLMRGPALPVNIEGVAHEAVDGNVRVYAARALRQHRVVLPAAHAERLRPPSGAWSAQLPA